MKPQDFRKALLQDTLIFLSPLMLVCALVGCSGGMEKEAETEATKELGQYVVKCGDAYIVKFIDGTEAHRKEKIVAYKAVDIAFGDNMAADRDEWYGGARVKFKGESRELVGNQWGEWQTEGHSSNSSFPVASALSNLAADIRKPEIVITLQKSKGGYWTAKVDQSGHWYMNVSCSDIPPDKHISTPEQEEAQRRYDQKRLEDLTKASRDIIRKNQEERATQGKP